MCRAAVRQVPGRAPASSVGAIMAAAGPGFVADNIIDDEAFETVHDTPMSARAPVMSGFV